jgi:hypothetical protein
MTNAERQQRWRDRHRTAQPPTMMLVHPSPAPAPPAIAAPPPAPAPERAPLAAKQLYQTHLRRLPPSQRLALARMILDDLAGAV